MITAPKINSNDLDGDDKHYRRKTPTQITLMAIRPRHGQIAHSLCSRLGTNINCDKTKQTKSQIC